MKKMLLFSLSLLLFSAGVNPFPIFSQSGKEIPFIEDNPQDYVFNNKEGTLLINKQTWQIELMDVDGKVHFAEYQKPKFLVDGNWITTQNGSSIKTVSEKAASISVPATNGFNFNLSVDKAGDSGFRLKWSLPGASVSNIKGIIRLNPVEEIYGFGETWNKHLAQRGRALEVWDEAGTPDQCAWMPYFVSTNNYAFFINYGGLVKFNVGQRKSDELVYEMSAKELEYTVVIGHDVTSTVQNFVALTGMPAKPPRWSFEPWFWLMGDPDIPGASISTIRGEHHLEMVAKLKELDIPVGVTWFEPPWQDANTTFIPNKEFSSDIKRLLAELDKQGVKTLAWTVPYTTPRASNWDEAVKKSYLVKKPGKGADNSKVKISKSGELDGTYYNKIDYYNPEAFKWWQGQIEGAIDLGFKGFKTDAGQGLPSDGILYGGRIGKDVHNSYALEYNRVFYNTLKKKLGDDFLMIPRAAWIGSGAFTNFKWPGDLRGSFANNGLPSSVYSSLSLAFSGIPFISSDIGGFSDQPASEHVWVRWAQFGAMLPGMQTLHMPWWYSKESLEHFRYLTWLHTDLIPYWETLANLAHETGMPICKPLIFDYQNDQETWYVDDEFTVGEYLLVAPLINKEVMRDVYLPEGEWFNFWNENEVFIGQQKVRWSNNRKVNGWKFPLYVKEGAVIPMEVINDVTGFGTKHSEGFITLAMWPEIYAENEFILNDREGPVPIITDWSEGKEIVIEWKGSAKDYIFRIHLKDGVNPHEIFAKEEILKQFDNLISFQEATFDGWFLDLESRKLWVKKYSNKKSGILKIDIT